MTSYPTPNLILNKVAGTDLSSSQYKAVALASDDAVDVAAADSSVIGFVMNSPALGAVAEIASFAGGAKAVAGGTITVGDFLKVDANGDLVYTSGNDAVAIAYESAVDNQVFGVLVLPPKAVPVQELTATGAVNAGVESVELNHATVIIAATIADAANHEGLFIVKDTSASGTAAHTLTLTAGTFDGTNNVVTMNAPDEALIVYFDSTGNGVIIANVGTVVLS